MTNKLILATCCRKNRIIDDTISIFDRAISFFESNNIDHNCIGSTYDVLGEMYVLTAVSSSVPFVIFSPINCTTKILDLNCGQQIEILFNDDKWTNIKFKKI